VVTLVSLSNIGDSGVMLFECCRILIGDPGLYSCAWEPVNKSKPVLQSSLDKRVMASTSRCNTAAARRSVSSLANTPDPTATGGEASSDDDVDDEIPGVSRKRGGAVLGLGTVFPLFCLGSPGVIDLRCPAVVL